MPNLHVVCRFAKHELNSRKNDEKQDPRAILYSLQRRFYALGQNEVAMRLTEGADRITFPGPTLSLLGHLHGSEQDLPNRPIEPTEATPTSRLNPKVRSIFKNFLSFLPWLLSLSLLSRTVQFKARLSIQYCNY